MAATSIGCFDISGSGTSIELDVAPADVWSALQRGAGAHYALLPADPSVTDPFHEKQSVHASGTLSLGAARTAQVWVYDANPTVLSLWTEGTSSSDPLWAAAMRALQDAGIPQFGK